MTLTLIPDAERLLVQFLLAQAELSAYVATRVYTEIPQNPSYPLVRVTRWGGLPPQSQPLYQDRPTIQVDVYGGSKRTAQQAAETIRQLLSTRLDGSVTPDGVVSRVEFGVLSDSPDATFTPPKPRIRFDITLTLHP